MDCKNHEEDIYESTIDTSKELSIQKAIAIFLEEQEKNKPKVKRPSISPKSGILKILLVLVMLAGLSGLYVYLNIPLIYVLAVFVAIVIIAAKKTVVWMILLYQKYAPDHVRLACVFEPSCSNYMLMAIEKYGLIKGGFKGIKRLFRCHYPNGGVDNP